MENIQFLYWEKKNYKNKKENKMIEDYPKLKIQELIAIINKEKTLAKYPLALTSLFYGLYQENYKITKDVFANRAIGEIFALCQENEVKKEDLINLFCESLTPIKNSERVENYDKCFHKKLKIQITKNNIDEYDIKDIFYPFINLENLKGSVEMCKKLLANEYKDQQTFCQDRGKLTTYYELLSYKEKQLQDFLSEFNNILIQKEIK